jgi:outer membrane protein W
MRRYAVLASLALATAALGPASAQDTHVKIFAAASYVSPLSEENVTVGSVTDSVKNANALGWDFGIEGRFTKWIGLEVDYIHANQDVKFNGQTIGSTTLAPLSATFDIHVVHSKIVDFYLGPTYSYVNWGDIKLNGSGSGLYGSNNLGTDSENAWGVSLGLDIGLGKHVAIVTGIRYLQLDLTPQGGQSAKVDPLFTRLGIGFRF